MAIRRTIGSMTGHSFFGPDFPLYVNRATESFELVEHSHDFVEVTYISEGKGFHYIGDRVVAVQKGDLFFIPVGTSHVFRPADISTNDRLIVYNCIFHPQFFERIATSISDLWAADDVEALRALQNEKSWFVHREQFGEVGVLMNQLHLEFSDKKAARRIMLFSYALQLLVCLVRSSRGWVEMETGAVINRLDLVLADMEQQLADPPSLTDIAAALNLGTRQFHRLIKKATGQTYMEYIQSLRMQKCCELLKKTDHKISLVAEQIGYKDMKYFHALFKRKTGLSPRQFRMQSRAKPE
ncbi:helix-turn-helix domain-containing protein [Paenibacillus agricola]|uniref:AraC family transcriptional regulator n=1 Tax=Paenibacillus agricola TaxID=2716264 RepID=A0ABX0J5J4_9BACL|nr:AraC family transcriptional regulator [Paenibacillus agricola]NHN31574.1 AraC family transcriptional regulator [Paenibacillus agricola]